MRILPPPDSCIFKYSYILELHWLTYRNRDNFITRMSRKKLSLRINDTKGSGIKKVTNTIKILNKVIHDHKKGKLVDVDVQY